MSLCNYLFQHHFDPVAMLIRVLVQILEPQELTSLVPSSCHIFFFFRIFFFFFWPSCSFTCIFPKILFSSRLSRDLCLICVLIHVSPVVKEGRKEGREGRKNMTCGGKLLVMVMQGSLWEKKNVDD